MSRSCFNKLICLFFICVSCCLSTTVQGADDFPRIAKWDTAVTIDENKSQGAWKGIQWHPDGKSVFVYGQNAMIQRWDIKSQKLLATYKGESTKPLMDSLAISPDGKLIATIDVTATPNVGNHIRIFDCESGKVIASLEGTAAGSPDGDHPLTFTVDSKFLLIGSGAVYIWDMRMAKTKILDPMVLQKRVILVAERQSMLFSKDGSVFIDRSDDVRTWDWNKRVVKATFRPGNSSEQRVALSPDGQSLILSQEPKRRILEVWDTRTGKISKKLAPVHQYVSAISISPDSRIVASSSGEGAVYLTSLATGKVIHMLNAKETEGDIYSIAFSPDGNILAITGKRIIQLWNVSRLIEESPSDSKSK